MHIVKKNYHTLSDDEIALLVKTEPPAFEELYSRYEKKVFSYLVQHQMNKAGDSYQVEDIVQEIFVNIYNGFVKGLYNPQKQSSMYAWILTVARNTYINKYRQETKRTICSLSDFQDEYGEVWKKIYLPFVPEEDYILKNILEYVSQMTSDLPQTLQEVMSLFSQGSKHELIAKDLNIPVQTVRTRIFRLRRIMCAKLKSRGTSIKSLLET